MSLMMVARAGANCRHLKMLMLLSVLLALTGCERGLWDPTVRVTGKGPQGHLIGAAQDQKRDAFKDRGGLGAETIALGRDDAAKTTATLQKGSGTFLRKVTPPRVDTTPGDVTLNFDGTDIREVVKVVLGDLLKVNYTLHPGVQGTVSLQTGRPLRREHLLSTLETLLRMNNAALIAQSGDSYDVVPVTNALQGKVVSQLGDSSRSLPSGYSIQIVPLRYIGAEEMSSILQPLAPEGSMIRVDPLRNLLVIAGTSPEMGNVLETIRVFDVDWMSGLSVGFFVLEFAKANDVVTQLQALLTDEGGTSPLKGLFRFVPVESANALLVVSPQERYIEQMKNWIERLDLAEASGDASERLFVYRVKHGDAEALAGILSELFGNADDREQNKTAGSVAPNLQRSSISSKKKTDGSTAETESKSSSAERPAAASSREIEMSSSVSIVADEVNNSLLVRSNPRDFKKILGALKQLDIVPLQVLVEATIVEITLAGNLQYGVQWELFGTAAKGQSNISLDGNLLDGEKQGINMSFPGFNWTVLSSPTAIKATLSALAGENLVNVLSSPSIMVMDNQTATIQVGQEVPVATTQQQGTTTDTTRLINSIEYKKTGVMLKVKPRVTPGGLVQMEIEQEVSTVAKTDSSSLDSPTFQTRNITSVVAVRSNQAVVLGGLIQDQQSDGKQGIPGLYQLPVIGALFGERSKGANRTELVVVLTPKVMSTDQDIDAVTEDFRAKVRGLKTKF
ncbi:MAG: type II secretion system secretin GspD [Chromatium okenii]|nr:type II secretion system secretin GspD [Chromatium okenii]